MVFVHVRNLKEWIWSQRWETKDPKMLKMGPSETKLEGGFLENQMEQVLWISGAWGTWQEPPTTLLFPAHCLGLQQIRLGEHLTLPCLRWSDFTQMEWIGVDSE